MKLRFEHPAWRRLAPPLTRTLVKIWLKTCPQEEQADPESLDLVRAGEPVLFTTWHCHLLSPLFFCHRYYQHSRPLVLMASPSRDGEFIADVARRLGFIVCPGSRRKGGAQTLVHMVSYFAQGHSGGLVADGSRGPARIAQKGVLFLAREAGVPIIPLGVAASRKLTLDTWDRFEMPLPFARIAILAGAPLRVPPQVRGPALETLRLELEARLNRLFELSQSYF